MIIKYTWNIAAAIFVLNNLKDMVIYWVNMNSLRGRSVNLTPIEALENKENLDQTPPQHVIKSLHK